MKLSMDNAMLSESNVKKSVFLWIALLILSLSILIFGIFFMKIQINWDNLIHIITWLFLSWMLLLLFPMYFENNIQKAKIENWINNDLDLSSLDEIKNILEEKKSKLELNWFDINNFQLNNKDENRYLFKNIWWDYIRSKRYVVWYNIPTNVFYLIKKNIWTNYNINDKFKVNFIDYDKENYPDFKFDNNLSISEKIEKIIDILKELS